LDNVDALFAQVPSPIWGVFSVPILDKGIKKEENQGKDLTRASVEAGVSHIVFTSIDREGQDKSENNPSEVPHFASKYRIEQDIKRAAAASNGQMTYTFLRPVAFFANLTDNFIGKAFVSMWRLNGLDRNLQMISTKDIGTVAAEAFLNASDERYRNTGISLAGDALTPRDAARIFKEETGQGNPFHLPLACLDHPYSRAGAATHVCLVRGIRVWYRRSGCESALPFYERFPYLVKRGERLE